MKKLLVLAAVGVAIKYFLDSENGKEVKSAIRDWFGEAQDAVKKQWDNASGRAQAAVDKMN